MTDAATAAQVGPHAFADSGQRETGPGGRSYAICETCGRKRIGPSHGRVAELAPYRDGSPRKRPQRVAGPGRPGPELVVPTAREVVQLALMLDAVLDLPAELVGWRLHLRAGELRKAMPEIPASRPARAHPVDARGEVGTMPAPPSDRARSGGVGASHDARGELPRLGPNGTVNEPRMIELAPSSTRSRARSLSKSIADRRMRELAARAIVDGWSLARSGGGHWKLTRGDATLVLPNTPTDHRSYANARAQARRLGVDVEGL